MSSELNKAVFCAHFEAIEDRRLDALDTHPALAGAKPFFEKLFAAFPDSTGTLHEVIAEDDWEAYRLTQRGTQRGEWMGIPASGKLVEWEVIGTMRIIGGMIVESHAQADAIGMMQQLGVAPPDGSASESS